MAGLDPHLAQSCRTLSWQDLSPPRLPASDPAPSRPRPSRLLLATGLSFLLATPPTAPPGGLLLSSWPVPSETSHVESLSHNLAPSDTSQVPLLLFQVRLFSLTRLHAPIQPSSVFPSGACTGFSKSCCASSCRNGTGFCGSHFYFPGMAGLVVPLKPLCPSQPSFLPNPQPVSLLLPTDGSGLGRSLFFLSQGSSTQGTSLQLQQGNDNQSRDP